MPESLSIEKPYGGFLFMVDEEQRADLIRDYVDAEFPDYSFTDTISSRDSKLGDIDVCLLTFGESSLSHIALMERGKKVATAKYLITLSRFTAIMPPLTLEELESGGFPNIGTHIVRASRGSGARVPPVTWSQLILLIKKLRPDIAPDLDDLDAIRRSRRERSTAAGFDIMAQEKDAIGLALDIFGSERRVFMSGRSRERPGWTPPQIDWPAPYLANLHEATLPEDVMIENDRCVFGDWESIASNQVGSMVFTKGNARLDIVNVNRRGVEHTLGVDLLYYHFLFDSYIMVQYKRMKREGDEWIYRPDKSFWDELERMKKFHQLYADTAATKLAAYRMHPSAFYFKLCRAVTYVPYASDLIDGMYLPLDYWEMLLASDNVKGPKGGYAITYDNVGRHVNNTLFVQLVEKGWVGSRGMTSQVISDIVSQSLQSNRSVMLAAETHVR